MLLIEWKKANLNVQLPVQKEGEEQGRRQAEEEEGQGEEDEKEEEEEGRRREEEGKREESEEGGFLHRVEDGEEVRELLQRFC